MAKTTDIDQVFLGILRDASDRDEIIKRTRYFKDYHWQSLGEFALEQNLFPPFYHRLLSLNLQNIPLSLLSRFKNLYLMNLKKNIILEQELFKVISYLRESNLSVIPLKGPVLARILYGNLALRQTSSDLDLLIRTADREEIEEKLKKLDYFIPYGQKNTDSIHRFSFEIHLYKRQNGQRSIILELHWDLRDRFVNTHLEEFWQDSRQINLDGQKILTPSDEDLLLYLALVSVYDISVRLKYVFDLHQLITKYLIDLDWQRLINKSKRNKLDKILFFALRSAKDLFATKIPEAALDFLRPVCLKENLFNRWVNKTVFKEKPDYSYLWNFFIIPYLYSKNTLDYIRIIYKKMFKPMSEIMGEYDQPLSYLASYYLYLKRLLRPFSILCQNNI